MFIKQRKYIINSTLTLMSLQQTSLEVLSLRAERLLFQREPLELVRSGKLFIRTKSGEIKSFVPNFAQKIVLEVIERRIKESKPVRIRLLKARQLGFSTLFQAITYAFTSRREGFHSLVIADDEEGSKQLFEMNKLFHEKLDPIFKPVLRKSNEIALEFDGLKSRIDIDTSRNKNAGRGSTYQIVHKSESSRFAFPKEVNLGVASAVPDIPGTMIFDETTANGMNFYFDDVQNSLRGTDGYDFIFIPWFYNPEYSLPVYDGVTFEHTEDEKVLIEKVAKLYKQDLTNAQLNWRRFTIQHKCAGDLNTFKQEYPSDHEEAFIFSGRPRFDVEILRRLKLGCKIPIAHDGLLDIYAHPDPQAVYTLGVDTSEGKIDGDKSSCVILNCKTFSVVAEYNGLLEPDILASHVATWGRLYNNALAVVEMNNHGLAMMNALKTMYQYLYYRKTFDKVANEWKESVGWQTSVKTKPILIGNLSKALRDGLTIESYEIVNELLSFIYQEDGTTSASEGKKDDRVIGLALAVQGALESDKSQAPVKSEPNRNSLEWFDRQKEYDKEQEAKNRGNRIW